MKPELGVGLVGYGFLGRAHSLAWTSEPQVFDLPTSPVRIAICGRDEDRATKVARQFGWQNVETDWRALVARDDVQLVDICTPGDSHCEIALAALGAGKHVLCEKPLANTVAQAESMAAAARLAAGRGVFAMVGFNYRRVPALALAHRLLSEDFLGQIRHVRASYLQDWLVDPEFPVVWRLRREHAGSGALGDLGAHLVDLVRYLLSADVSAVSAATETFVPDRPVPLGPSSGLDGAASGAVREPVSVDDSALFIARLSNGALASFEATRFATGRKNALRLEINGDRGSIAFDLERLNELEIFEVGDDLAGFRRVLVTESAHPYLDAWWPPGHVLGWEHTFVHQARDLLRAIADGHQPRPSFEDGLEVQRVLDAVERSSASGRWVSPGS